MAQEHPIIPLAALRNFLGALAFCAAVFLGGQSSHGQESPNSDLGGTRFDEAIGVICAPLSDQVIVLNGLADRAGIAMPASAFVYPLPVFETRRFLLRISRDQPEQWVRYRQVSWRLFSSPFGEVGDAGASRGFGSAEQRGAEISHLCGDPP